AWARGARRAAARGPPRPPAPAPRMTPPAMTARSMTRNSGAVTASAGFSGRNGSSDNVTAWRFATAIRTMRIARGNRTSAATIFRIMGCPPWLRARTAEAPAGSFPAVQPLAHFLAGLEERHALLIDGNARARARVASFARRPALHREGPEATQLHAIAVRQGIGDLVEDGVDDVFHVALVQVRILRRDP